MILLDPEHVHVFICGTHFRFAVFFFGLFFPPLPSCPPPLCRLTQGFIIRGRSLQYTPVSNVQITQPEPLPTRPLEAGRERGIMGGVREGVSKMEQEKW